MNDLVTSPDFENLENLSRGEIRDIIARVASSCAEGPMIEVPIEHYFSQDVYAREMKMKKGEIVVGKIHKFKNLNILSSGEVSVLSIDGVMRIKAPYTFVASPGAQRLIYAHEDCTWTVIHGTNETNVDKIEETFIAKDYEEIENKGDKICLGS